MALTTEEQELLDFALGSLPEWFGDDESRDLEVEAGIAKMFGMVRTQIAYWFDQALILQATGTGTGTPDWLQQHAIDRGTRRADGEADPELRDRLRTYADAISPPAILSAAQSIIDAAGVSGTVELLELRQHRAFLIHNLSQAGIGGTFIAGAGDLHRFEPSSGWAVGGPPFQEAGVEPDRSFQITLVGSSAPANDGTFQIEALAGDAVEYTNAAGVASGSDLVANWRVDRLDQDGNVLTSPSGRADAYLSRGHRMGPSRGMIVLILPFGTSAATAASVAEAVRQRKAAGFQLIVERRQ